MTESCWASYTEEIELVAQIWASFPHPGDNEKLLAMIIADIGVDTFGINVRGAVKLLSIPVRLRCSPDEKAEPLLFGLDDDRGFLQFDQAVIFAGFLTTRF